MMKPMDLEAVYLSCRHFCAVKGLDPERQEEAAQLLGLLLEESGMPQAYVLEVLSIDRTTLMLLDED